MIKLGIRIENINGLDAQFEEVIAAIEANLEEVADYTLQEAVTTEAFVNRKNDLRPSIKKLKSKFENGGYIIRASGKGKDKGYHAHLVEFGHVMLTHSGMPTKLRRVPPHPFMRPAAEKGIVKAIQLFRVTKK